MIKAIFLDMDNTLTLGNAFRELYNYIDPTGPEEAWVKYIKGEEGFTYHDSLKSLANALREAKASRAMLTHLFNQIPLTADLEATINELQKRDIKCIVLTCGSEELYKRIDNKLRCTNGAGFDDCFGVKSVYDENNIILDFVPSIEYMDKGAPIREMKKKYGWTSNDCASIGDSLGDYGMFLECGTCFAYNPSGDLTTRLFQGRLNKELDGKKIFPLKRGEFKHILDYL